MLFAHNWHRCNWFDIIVDSQTALHHAARNGHLRCLKVLLDHGAIVDVKNNEGKTAMQIALDKGEYDCAKYLKTVQGIKHFLVILRPTVPTNTYLPYKGSALPPLFTATPLPTLISYGQTPPPFYFRIIYLFLDPYLIMNHQNHPVDCGPSLLFSVPPSSLLLASFPPSIHPTSLSFFLLSPPRCYC